MKQDIFPPWKHLVTKWAGVCTSGVHLWCVVFQESLGRCAEAAETACCRTSCVGLLNVSSDVLSLVRAEQAGLRAGHPDVVLLCSVRLNVLRRSSFGWALYSKIVISITLT